MLYYLCIVSFSHHHFKIISDPRFRRMVSAVILFKGACWFQATCINKMLIPGDYSIINVVKRLYTTPGNASNPSFRSVRFLRLLSKYFAQIYRAQYGSTMMMYLQGTQTWRPENSVNIWNLL